jgi:hypothetical protein
MIRTILLASGLALGTATVHAAPQLVGGGDEAHVEYGGLPGGSPVGGGHVRLSGGGNDRSYAYGAMQAQPGRVAVLVGGGDEAQVVYLPAAPAAGLARNATHRVAVAVGG